MTNDKQDGARNQEENMRICVVRHGYFPQDPRVRKEVLALLDAGLDVTILCLRDEGETDREVWNGATIFRLPLRHDRGNVFHYVTEYLNSFVRAFFKISSLHLSRPFDVVQINTMPDFLAFCALIPKFTGAKIVLDMHELMPEFFRSKFKQRYLSVFVGLISIVERLAVAFADVVLFPSEICKNVIIQRSGGTRKHAIIFNTPDETLFKSETTPVNAVPAYDLIAHGTITQRYGYEVLLRALCHVAKKLPEIRLCVAGGGEYLPELRSLAQKLGLDGHITFTGKVPIETMASFIHSSRIGIIPVIKDEFTQFLAPNKLFEYIAMNVPVICADIPGIRECVSDNDVLFFNSGDEEDLASKIVMLMNNQEMIERLTSSARKAYEHVRWNNNRIVYREVIMSCAEEARAGR